MNLVDSASASRALAAAFSVEGDVRSPAWHVRSFEIVEELSGRFAATAELEHDGDLVAHAALLGRSAMLTVWDVHDVARRHQFSGVVRRVDEVARTPYPGGRWCRVHLEPAFGCLVRAKRTTRFVEMTVPAILREVLRDALAPFENRAIEFRLGRASADPSGDIAFAVREHCAQYGESTYDFCRRLLAEEGMSYFFEHRDQAEVLVIVDGNSGFRPLACDSIPYLRSGDATPRTESIFRFCRTRSQTAEQVRLRPFDFLDPDRSWESSARTGEQDQAEESAAASATRVGRIFDPHPVVSLHGYLEKRYTRSDLDTQTRIQIEREIAQGCSVSGAGNVLSFAPGRLFRLLPAPGESLPDWAAGVFLITSVRHTGRFPPPRSEAGSGEGARYTNEFTCIPESLAFRPSPLAKPLAIEDLGEVVSASEDDPTWTDEHGRIRVRFLFERREEVTAGSPSAWIPLSQAWVGSGYGFQTIPRVGMVVQIGYMFGDPDRPVVTGCLPTGRNQLPSPLPERKTRSTIRTQSYRDGARDVTHYNEITMEDAAGAEELLLQAARDLRQEILNDEHTEIDRDERRLLGGAQRIRILGQRMKVVHQGERITVDGERSVFVEADDHRAVTRSKAGDGTAGGQDADTVDGDQSVTVIGARTTEVHELDKALFEDGRTQVVLGEEGDDQLRVTKGHVVTADEEWRAAQGKTAATLAAGDAVISAHGDIQLSTDGGMLELRRDGEAALEANELRVVCGRSSMTIGAERIALRADEVVARGAKGAIRLGADGATTTGTNIVASAVMINELKGPLVVISDTPGTVDPLAPAERSVKVREERIETLEGQEAKPDEVDLEVVLMDHQLAPAANARYRLMLPSGEVLNGTADGGGKLRQTIPAHTKTIDVVYLTDEDSLPIARTLHLDEPPEAAEAQIHHMRHLGFGAPTWPDDQVVRAFQRAAGLPQSGDIDAATRAALARAVSGRGVAEEDA